MLFPLLQQRVLKTWPSVLGRVFLFLELSLGVQVHDLLFLELPLAVQVHDLLFLELSLAVQVHDLLFLELSLAVQVHALFFFGAFFGGAGARLEDFFFCRGGPFDEGALPPRRALQAERKSLDDTVSCFVAFYLLRINLTAHTSWRPVCTNSS